MKIQLKTKYWTETEIEVWKERQHSMSFRFGVFFLANIIFSMYNDSLIMGIANAIPFLIVITIWLSYNKYKKQTEEEKNEKKNQT